MSRFHAPRALTSLPSARALLTLLILTVGCTSTQPQPTDKTRAAGDAQALALSDDSVLEQIGFGSCLHQDDPQPILDVVVERDFDLFLMLGDNVYGDVTSTVEMTELHQAYEQQAASEAFQALRNTTPMLAVWDDHDFDRKS